MNWLDDVVVKFALAVEEIANPAQKAMRTIEREKDRRPSSSEWTRLRKEQWRYDMQRSEEMQYFDAYVNNSRVCVQYLRSDRIVVLVDAGHDE